MTPLIPKYLTRHVADAPSLSEGYLNYAKAVMLAQAQECVVQKAWLDGLAPMTIAEVAAQVVEFCREAEEISVNECDRAMRGSLAAAGWLAESVSFIRFKKFFYNAVAYYECGCDAVETTDRIAYFKVAQQQLDLAAEILAKIGGGVVGGAEALTAARNLIDSKLEAAEKNNDVVVDSENIAVLPAIACGYAASLRCFGTVVD